MSGGLLNPPVEAAVCRRMMNAVSVQKQNLDNILTSRLLDREAYLQTFAKREALHAVLTELTGIYDKEFNI